MVYPNAYITFLIHFHGNHDYFECHEVLEDYWKQTEPGNRYSVWVGFIQLAVAQYHYRRDNKKGAKKLLKKAIEILKTKRLEINNLGINAQELFILLYQLQRELNEDHSYKSVELPIFDKSLLLKCKKECEKLGFQWCNKNEKDSDFIVNRHILRNRSNIELNRYLSKLSKNNNMQKKCIIK